MIQNQEKVLLSVVGGIGALSVEEDGEVEVEQRQRLGLVPVCFWVLLASGLASEHLCLNFRDNLK